MPLPTIPSGNVASALGGAFEVANSCRFNGDAYMHKSLSATATHADKCTFSIWVKPQVSDNRNTFVAAGVDSGNYMKVRLQDDKVAIYGNRSSQNDLHVVTNRVLRDPSAWYHIVLQIDTTQSTAGNRVKFFVNGVQETSLSTTTYMDQNADCFLNGGVSSSKLFIGAFDTAADDGVSEQGEGYFAEVALIDGSILAPTEFGEYDEDSPTIWKPKDISGLTFGANGFYLDFEDSANLGNDKNGGTDLTEVSIAAADQSVDTPTNNFCTINPLDNYYASSTLSEGNTQMVTHGGNYTYNTGTIALTTGKWYFETKFVATTQSDANQAVIGISDKVSTATTKELGDDARAYAYYSDSGDIFSSDSGTSYGGVWDASASGVGKIIGCYLDLDNSKIYFSIDGTIQNSGTGHSITAVGSTDNGFYFPAWGDRSGDTYTYAVNFGGGQFAGTAVSSGNADANGYGNFEYDPSSGTFDGSSKNFLAICTKNLGSDGG
jgi:hypothetical protein